LIIFLSGKQLVNGEILNAKIKSSAKKNESSEQFRSRYAWAIQKNAEKPIDVRRKKEDKCVNNFEGGIENGKQNFNYW
jgi:hypothetical protein